MITVIFKKIKLISTQFSLSFLSLLHFLSLSLFFFLSFPSFLPFFLISFGKFSVPTTLVSRQQGLQLKSLKSFLLRRCRMLLLGRRKWAQEYGHRFYFVVDLPPSCILPRSEPNAASSSANSKCNQPCAVVRSDCGHPCNTSCHGKTACPRFVEYVKTWNFIFLSIYHFIHTSVYLTINPSLYPSIDLPINPFTNVFLYIITNQTITRLSDHLWSYPSALPKSYFCPTHFVYSSFFVFAYFRVDRTICKIQIRVNCKCGRKSETMACPWGASKESHQSFQNLTTQVLASKYKVGVWGNHENNGCKSAFWRSCILIWKVT